MNRAEFSESLRDLLNHLFDPVAVESHPVTRSLEAPPGGSAGRGKYLQKVVRETIEGMQPDIPFALDSVEWRPYLILQKRYIQGLSMPEIADQLALSERQVRRDHSRAVKALCDRVWEIVHKPGLQPSEQAAPTPAARQVFQSHPEFLRLNEVLDGVIMTVSQRIHQENLRLELDKAPEELQLRADRVIIRQVIIGLLNYLISIQSGEWLRLESREQSGRILIRLRACGKPDCREKKARHVQLLASITDWIEQLNAELEEEYPPEKEPGEIRLTLSIPVFGPPVILVVDDQLPSVRMFQRYLSRTPYRVVGLADPQQVTGRAVEIRPAAITLDIMMPGLDGWELLQALQADETTREIPVIVCSAWEDPELARSLGAAAFLKKPVTQRDLLETLRRLDLPLG